MNELKNEHDLPRIISNKIRCRKCGDIIESKYRHDFVRCKCGACAADGGKVYLRRVGNFADWEELSELEEDTDAIENLQP